LSKEKDGGGPETMLPYRKRTTIQNSKEGTETGSGRVVMGK